MSGLRHTRRVAVRFAFAFSFGWLGLTGQANAEFGHANEFDASLLAATSPFHYPLPADQFAAQPFGASLSIPVKGGLETKWSGVKKKLPRESRILAQCRADMTACPPAAKRFIVIIDRALRNDGRARIAEINRAINLDIRPVDDRTQHGKADRWTTPLMTFASKAGDCEDYAIAKYVALHEIGIAEDDIRLLVIHDRATGEDHAVTAVRLDGQWQILDNRTLDIRRDVDITEFDPLFVVDSTGVKRLTATAPKPLDPWVSADTATMSLSLLWPVGPLHF